MGMTTDPRDPRLTRGADEAPAEQAEVYLVLSSEERRRGFLQPVRTSYVHQPCGTATHMNVALAETYARDPWFYGGTYCCACRMHRPLTEFRWSDGQPMAPHEWPDETLKAVMERKASLEARNA